MTVKLVAPGLIPYPFDISETTMTFSAKDDNPRNGFDFVALVNSRGDEVIKLEISVERTRGEVRWRSPRHEFTIVTERTGPNEVVVSLDGESFQAELTLVRAGSAFEARLTCSEEQCNNFVAKAEVTRESVSVSVDKERKTKFSLKGCWDFAQPLTDTSFKLEVRVCDQWGRIEFDAQDRFTRGQLLIETSNPMLAKLSHSYEYKASQEGLVRKEEISSDIRYNEQYFIQYKSDMQYSPTEWRGRTTKKTNIAWAQFREEVETFLFEFEPNSRVPKHINLKTVHDGTVVFEFDLELDVRRDGIEARAKVLGIPSPAARHQVTVKAKTDFKRMATLQIDTDIRGLETIRGKVTFQRKSNGSREVKAAFQVNGEDLAKVGLAFTASPYFKAILKFEGRGGLQQSLELMHKAERRFDGEVASSGKLAAKGALFDGQVDFRSKKGGGDFSLDVDVEGTSRPLCERPPLFFPCSGIQYKARVAVSRARRRGKLSVKNARLNLEHVAEVAADFDDPRDVELALHLQAPRSGAGITLGWDVLNPTKTFGAQLSAGRFQREIRSSTFWTPARSDLSGKVVVDGRETSFSWSRRDGFRDVSGRVTFRGDNVFTVRNLVSGERDFDFTADLTVGGEHYGRATLEGREDPGGTLGIKGEATLPSERVDYLIEYSGEGWLGGPFNLEVTSKSDRFPSLSVFLEDKVDGKELTVEDSEGRKVIVSGNLHQLRNLPLDADLVLFAHFTCPRESRTAQLTVNRAEKTLSFYADDTLIVNCSAELDGGQSLTLRAEVEGEALDNRNLAARLDLKKEAAGKGEVGLAISADGQSVFESSVELEIGEGKLELEASVELPMMKKKASLELELKGEEEEKSGELSLQLGGDRKIEIEVEKKEGELLLRAETPVQLLRNFELRCDLKDEDALLASMAYNEGGQNSFSLRFAAERDGAKKEASIEVETGGNKISSDVNLNLDDRTLSFRSNFNQDLITLDLGVDDNDNLSLEFTSPLPGFTSISLTGSWTPTPSGAVLEATGSVELDPLHFKAEIFRAEEGESFVMWSMARGARQIKFKISSTRSPTGRKIGTQVDVFNQHSEFNLWYRVDGTNFLKASASFEIPLEDLRAGEVEFRVGYENPKNLEFTAKAAVSYGLSSDAVLFDMRNVINYESLDNVVLSAVLEIPPLGVGKVGTEVVFRVKSKQDFEILSELTLPGRVQPGPSYGFGVKFLKEERKVDFSAKLTKGPGLTYELALGGEHTCSGEKRGAATAYARAAVGRGGATELRAEVDVDVPRKTLSATLTIISGLRKRLVVAVEYEHEKSLRGSLKVNSGAGHDEDMVTFAVRRSGRKVNLNIWIVPGVVASTGIRADILLDLTDGSVQSFEVSVRREGGGSNGVRVKRSADGLEAMFSGPSFGEYEMKVGEGMSSGIVFLKTDSSLHKLTYLVRSASDFTVAVDSPLLPSGPVSMKVKLDPQTSTFHGSIASEEVNYLSGSLEYTRDQLILSLEQVNPYLPGNTPLRFLNNFRAKISVSKRRNAFYQFAAEFNHLVEGSHSCRMMLDLDRMALEVKLKSPTLLGENLSLVAGLKKNGQNFSTEAEFSYYGKVKANGHISLINVLNFDGVAKVELDEDTLLNVFYGLKWNGQEREVFLHTLSDRSEEVLNAKFRLDLVKRFLEVVTPREEAFSLTWDDSGDGEYEAVLFTPHGRVHWKAVVGENVINVDVELPLQKRASLQARYWVAPEHVVLEFSGFGPSADKFGLTLDAAARPSERTAHLNVGVLINNRHLLRAELEGSARSGRYSLEGAADVRLPALPTWEYGFAIAFENTERKTLKAYYKCPDGGNGLALDYHFASAVDLAAEARLSLPFLGLAPQGVTVRMRWPGTLVVSFGRGFSDEKRLAVEMRPAENSIHLRWDDAFDWALKVNAGGAPFSNQRGIVLKARGAEVAKVCVFFGEGSLPHEVQAEVRPYLALHLRKEQFAKLAVHLEPLLMGELTVDPSGVRGAVYRSRTMFFSEKYGFESRWRFNALREAAFTLVVQTPKAEPVGVRFEYVREGGEVINRLVLTRGEEVVIHVKERTGRSGYEGLFTLGGAHLGATASVLSSSSPAVGSSGSRVKAAMEWGFLGEEGSRGGLEVVGHSVQTGDARESSVFLRRTAGGRKDGLARLKWKKGGNGNARSVSMEVRRDITAWTILKV